jgi:hypothetical protein
MEMTGIRTVGVAYAAEAFAWINFTTDSGDCLKVAVQGLDERIRIRARQTNRRS